MKYKRVVITRHGGPPAVAVSGRNVIQIICTQDKKAFVTKIP